MGHWGYNRTYSSYNYNPISNWWRGPPCIAQLDQQTNLEFGGKMFSGRSELDFPYGSHVSESIFFRGQIYKP